MWILLFLIGLGILLYHRASLIVTSIAFTIGLILFSNFSEAYLVTKLFAWIIFLAIAIPLNITSIRRQFISRIALAVYRKLMPSMSRTERDALDSGTVGFEGELFSGKPNWSKLLKTPGPKLSLEEQAFLDNETEELCRMINEWEITFTHRDLPPAMWEFLKKKGFFAMIIPKQYGGKQFSAYAHSQVIAKVASRSMVVASTVSVPNSLGPAELLLHYGTDEQKNYYLPRLAKGDEVPCFALTSPEAGSDAAAMPDHGIVCRGSFEGKEIIGMRLTWDKRYITLAPVATVLGLAFKLFDPDHLIGDQTDLGITCGLIPTHTKGVQIGRRHLPLDAPFQNGPTYGKEVFVPLDWIIGGVKMAGQGWRMLMECLSAGRAISLPSTVTGGAKAGLFATGAYVRIRKQFGVAIGQFEGIQQILARMTYNTYAMDAVRTFTATAVDNGERPAVASAIAKAHVTERGRQVVSDAMDIHGGKGICLGPNNYLGRAYQAAPISITVEGANLLTRCLIIFGQGAMRCHPFIYAELKAAQLSDETERLRAFDAALFGHLGFISSNKIRSLWLALTGGYLVVAPMGRELRRYFQLLERYSAAFALLADACVVILGAEVKRKEAISARLGDVLSYLYIISTVLKRYIVEGLPKNDLPVLHYTCQEFFFLIQETMNEILQNIPNRIMRFALRALIFPVGRNRARPIDTLMRKVAEMVISPTETRQRLTLGIAMKDPNSYITRLENAMNKIIACEDLEKRLAIALRERKIKGITIDDQIQNALAVNVINAEEARQLTEAHQLRSDIIAVDHFAHDELVQFFHEEKNMGNRDKASSRKVS